MNKELKKEIIIKNINKVENEELLDFLFGFVIGYDRKKQKKRKITMKDKKIDEITIKLLDIQNRFN